MTGVPRRYTEQIEEMTKRGAAWYREHPDQAVVVRWRFPRYSVLIGTWSQARRAGLVELNDAAQDLVAAMVADWPPRLEPTPLMVRVALELAREARR